MRTSFAAELDAMRTAKDEATRTFARASGRVWISDRPRVPQVTRSWRDETAELRAAVSELEAHLET